MFKFFHLKKIKLILSTLTLSKYLFWCVFFYFQGNAIQKAIEKQELVANMIFTLIVFVVAKLIMMLVELLSTFTISYFENKEINRQWKTQFPIKLFRDTENKDNLICLLYFDYIPNLFNLECANIINICTINSILFIILFLTIYTQFYFGLISLLIIFSLSFLSKNIGLNRIDYYQKKSNESKAFLFRFIHQYFKAYREIAFNWEGQLAKWSKNQHSNLYQNNKKIIFIHLLRDIFSQLFIELPFVINTCMVILGVYFQYLSVTQMFIWIGLSQFVIQSSNCYLEFKLNKVKKNMLLSKVNEIFTTFSLFPESFLLSNNSLKRITQIKNPEDKLIDPCEIQKAPLCIEVKLQDDSSTCLSRAPALYHIKGKNGSGKTTLLNIILGYERILTIKGNKAFKTLLTGPNENIRLVEKDPVIFESFHLFHHQILGPENYQFIAWRMRLKNKMNGMFTLSLAKELIRIFEEIEEKFNSRVDKHFSSGEKVMISFFRAIYSWNQNVSFLIIDECTAFLDSQIRRLFMQCLTELSETVAVYLCAHDIKIR